MDLCVTSCGQTHWRTLEMRRLRNTLLTTQSGGARTSTGEYYYLEWVSLRKLVLVLQ